VQALICNLSSWQNKNHNAAQNELGIKAEKVECSDVKKTQGKMLKAQTTLRTISSIFCLIGDHN
jgi:hypothetical protein